MYHILVYIIWSYYRNRWLSSASDCQRGGATQDRGLHAWWRGTAGMSHRLHAPPSKHCPCLSLRWHVGVQPHICWPTIVSTWVVLDSWLCCYWQIFLAMQNLRQQQWPIALVGRCQINFFIPIIQPQSFLDYSVVEYFENDSSTQWVSNRCFPFPFTYPGIETR